MAQYLLSVHSVEGEAREPMTDEEMQQSQKQLGVLEQEMKSAGAWVFSGRLHEPDTATVVRDVRRRGADHRRPLRGVQGAPRRLLHHRGRGPRRRARSGRRRSPRAIKAPIEVRPFAGIRGLTAWATATPRPGSTSAEVGRIFREESGRSVAALIRAFGDIDVAEDAVQEAFAVALRRWPRDGLPPNPGGWITTTARNRAIDRLRRESRGRELLSEVAVLVARQRRSRHARGGGARAGRPASPHLHLLPPGAVHRGAGGADPAPARRPVDQRRSHARSSSPSRRWRNGSCAPSARSRPPGSPTACPRTTSCPTACAPCWPSSTSSTTPG